MFECLNRIIIIRNDGGAARTLPSLLVCKPPKEEQIDLSATSAGKNPGPHPLLATHLGQGAAGLQLQLGAAGLRQLGAAGPGHGHAHLHLLLRAPRHRHRQAHLRVHPGAAQPRRTGHLGGEKYLKNLSENI